MSRDLYQLIHKPPNDRCVGWPWTAPEEKNAGWTASSALPLTSIIVPSFNQGRFIEETIRSIILQNYPNLELIVIDGGSTDETIDVIKKYESWVTYWVTERDSGQANAINKGLRVAKGEIVKWLNSDDLLLPGALHELAAAYLKNKDKFFVSPVVHFLSGTDKRRVFQPRNVTHEELVQFWSGKVAWNDPGSFYTRRILATVGGIDESYRYSFDYEFVLRVSKKFDVVYLDKPAAAFRVHSESKTVAEGERFIYETAEVSEKYWEEIENLDRRGFEKYFAVSMFRNAIRNMLHRPVVAMSYLRQAFGTNILRSPWWFAKWGLSVIKVRARSRLGQSLDTEWSGFGVS